MTRHEVRGELGTFVYLALRRVLELVFVPRTVNIYVVHLDSNGKCWSNAAAPGPTGTNVVGGGH
jgi:hypothetical protein